ncbi:uncharacterized protein LOC124956937 isoform X1 [Vespa velutina]|uniref:uncharacterized protein LOC124956937 isoform X1 n=1 Tax=Vespa velutina TaxID=202808 RepID=UPI001FB35F8B|nr:uncharacterized protein LOC124956937 isoform X1 [Vespa velutina]XP_047369376.1 uncharacterized protein LOC124956937 isoform X1 [Vespa velutina]XP_047369386.1 uncharacterized protein LOC124956937 isoform X1 [Vespa velutina]
MQIYCMLMDFNCLRDLNLDGNPNVQENYHLLCKSVGNLSYLSLQFCKITDEGVKKIADELQYADPPNEPKLLALNLANNRIGDSGALEIGRMLRTNRSVQSLILTGNRICDDGASLIIQELNMLVQKHDYSIKEFNNAYSRISINFLLQIRSKLTHNEIVDLRRRRFDALILREKKLIDLNQRNQNELSKIVEDLPNLDILQTRRNSKVLKKSNKSKKPCLRYQTYMMLNDTSKGLLYVRIEGNEFNQEDEKYLIELEEILRYRQAGEYLSRSEDLEDSIILENDDL